jgi:putative tricarboxylic transport membrane protein
MGGLNRSHPDVVSGGLLVLLSAAYFVGTWSLPEGKGEPGPAFFPILLAGALGLSGLAILFQGLKKRNEETPPGHAIRKPGLAALLTTLYVALFQTLGFAVSTWLYTLSVTLMFRRDRLLVPIVVPIVSTVLIYLLFQVGLGVRLPSGFMGWP